MTGPRDEADAEDWMRLIRTRNVGPATFHDLLRRYGTARRALEALPDLATAAGHRGLVPATAAEVARERAAGARLGVRFVFLGTADYPPLLAQIPSPPPVLTVRGSVAALHRRAVAVVGSRQASAAGRTFSRRLATEFGRAGLVVVSGLALGIDAEAHEAALLAGTVAVVAGGVDRPTPAENLPLAARILEAGGAIVSEMPLGTEPVARYFVRRNRLIAGLSEGVVVVEAAERSGSLHTAHFAAEANREVFAVPGSPLDPRAAGCLALLREGARIVVEPRDVVEGLARPAGGLRLGAGFAEEEEPFELPAADALGAVAQALSLAPVPVDWIVRATGLPSGAVIGALVELELAGRAEREPDGTVRAVP